VQDVHRNADVHDSCKEMNTRSYARVFQDAGMIVILSRVYRDCEKASLEHAAKASCD
jgi:hypothetical protein